MSAMPADVAIPTTVSIADAMFRVNHWWRVSRGDVQLGFSRRSVIGKVMEEGCQGASHGRAVQPAPWMAPADEEVDRIIARMPPQLREAVIADQDQGASYRLIAAKLHSSPGEVRRWIENAYGFVAGALTASLEARDGR